MNRLLVLAPIMLGFASSFAAAAEIKNVRPCWGLPFGATRFETNCQPGDWFFMTYDIEGLEIDPKTKKVSYDTTLELLDGDAKTGKVVFKNTTPHEAIPGLGGARMPGDLQVSLGQKPGKYTVKLTIYDKIAKKPVAIGYELQVLPEGFGFIKVLAPAIGFPGQHHIPYFSLVNMGLAAVEIDLVDAEGKKTGKKLKVMQPDAEVAIRILDDQNKEVVTPAKMSLPADLPGGTDLTKANIIQLNYPVHLNRVGRFTVEIVATDKISKKSAKLSYPLTVLDVGSFANK